MSKDVIWTPFLTELRNITESTHDENIRDAVRVLIDYKLKETQGWTEDDFKLK